MTNGISLESSGDKRTYRPAYKSQAAKWRMIAILMLTGWMFTLGLLLWTLRRPVDIIKVIAPTSYEGVK